MQTLVSRLSDITLYCDDIEIRLDNLLYSNHQFFRDSERKRHANICKHRPAASVQTKGDGAVCPET